MRSPAHEPPLAQRNFWRSLIQSEPGQPAIASGVRAAIGFGVPLIIGQLIDRRDCGLLVGLIAFFINITNVDGSYYSKAKTMMVATVGVTLSVFVGLLVGNVPLLAVILTLLWGLAVGFAPLYGNASDKVGLVIGLSFLFAIGHPSNLDTALVQSLLCLLAGSWAMLLSLILWPFQPDRPLRLAVAACFNDIAIYLRAFRDGAVTTEQILAIRARLEQARGYLGTVRIGQSAPSWLDEQLLVLIQDGDRLFGSTIALTELLTTHAQNQQYRSVQPLIIEALTAITLILQSIATVIAGKSASIDLGHLERIYEALQDRKQIQRQAIDGSHTNYLNVIALANLGLILAKFINQLQYAAQSAQFLNDRVKNRRNSSYNALDLRLLVKDDARSSIADATPTPLSLLRENLTLDSAIFCHAIRLSISLSIGVVFYSTIPVLMGYWVTLTIMLVLKPNLGATFQRFFQRVGGTLLGALIAAILLATIASKPLLDIIIVVTVFFGAALNAFNYGSSVVFSSIFILLIAELTDVNDAMGWQLAGFRILNTFVGAILAFGSHYFIWPNWERDRLPSQLATALTAARDYFNDVMAVYQGTRTSDSTISRHRRQTGLAIGNAQASFQGLLREPQLSTAAIEPVMTLLVYLRRFTSAVTVLAVHLEHVRSTAPLPALTTFVCQVSLTLEQLATAVKQQTTPPPLPDLEATLRLIQPHLRALQLARIQELPIANGNTPIRQAVMDYSILDLEIDQIFRRLTAMHSAICCLERRGKG
jgi:uncharacterized membrane protein YccC